jgi:uncharacterized protein (TIGR00299 family) protein
VTDRPGAAYIDATAGVAGDMLLAALLDAGADVERVRGAITSLGVPGLGLRTEAARRGGLACLRAVITTPAAADRQRRLADVLGHVGASDLRPAGKDLATRVFRLLAEAEGAVHGEPPEDVHFHEVGAFDSLADVVGSAAALEDLGLLRPGAVVGCSALAAGSGFVTSRHGRLPVPAPAVLRIAAAAGLDLAGGDLAGERTTPTGAALLAAAATPGGFPAMTVRAVGTGGGGRDTPDRPNITRVVIGVSGAERDLREGDVTVVESTVDDLDPRLWPSVLQAVRAAGAWDCWCTPIVGRHGRPGQVLTALCAEPVFSAVAAAIFAHTGTLGVRWSRMNRLTAPRTSVEVEVGPPGSSQVVTVKVADTAEGLAGFGTATAELAEAEAAARALGWPVRAVCEAAVAQYRAQAAAPRLQLRRHRNDGPFGMIKDISRPRTVTSQPRETRDVLPAAVASPVSLASHLVQLGAGQRGIQRAALDDVGELLVADAEPVGEFHGLGDAFDEDGQVGVDHQLDDAALAYLTQPHGLAADGVEDRAQRAGRGFGAGCEDEQLALFGRALAARDRGVDERHAGPGRGQPVPAAQGRLNADRAHLRPHASLGERGGYVSVENDRFHGRGGGQHGDHHGRAPHRVRRRCRGDRARADQGRGRGG